MAKLGMSHCQKNLVHINMSLTLLHTFKLISKKSADMGFPNSMATLLYSNGCRQFSVGLGMANMLSQWRWRGTLWSQLNGSLMMESNFNPTKHIIHNYTINTWRTEYILELPITACKNWVLANGWFMKNLCFDIFSDTATTAVNTC